MTARRFRPRTIVACVVVVVVIASLPFGFFALRKRLASRVGTRFAACLAGPPIAADETAESRLRRRGSGECTSYAAAMARNRRSRMSRNSGQAHAKATKSVIAM